MEKKRAGYKVKRGIREWKGKRIGNDLARCSIYRQMRSCAIQQSSFKPDSERPEILRHLRRNEAISRSYFKHRQIFLSADLDYLLNQATRGSGAAQTLIERLQIAQRSRNFRGGSGIAVQQLACRLPFHFRNSKG